MPWVRMSESTERSRIGSDPARRGLPRQHGRVVVDDVKRRRPVHRKPLLDPGPVEPGRVDEDLRSHAAVHVHLVEAPAVGFDIDHHRRKHTRNRRRREQHVVDQRASPRRPAGRNARHAPGHRPGCVEVRRADQQRAAAAMLLGQFGHEGVVDVLLEQAPQRCGTGGRLVAHDVEQVRGARSGPRSTVRCTACEAPGRTWGPRKANGAISAPVLVPVTMVNSGRVPCAVQPTRMPAP